MKIDIKNIGGALQINVPHELIVFALENHPTDPWKVTDVESFMGHMAFELENNLGTLGSELTGLQELLDKAANEIVESGSATVEKATPENRKIVATNEGLCAESNKLFAIEFHDWVTSLSPSKKVSVWSKSGEHKGLFDMDTEQLVDKFISIKSFSNFNKKVEESRANATMTATGVSEYAKTYMIPSELADLETMLPCECYETEEKSPIDNTFLIALHWMTDKEDFIHRKFLIISQD